MAFRHEFITGPETVHDGRVTVVAGQGVLLVVRLLMSGSGLLRLRLKREARRRSIASFHSLRLTGRVCLGGGGFSGEPLGVMGYS